MLEFTLQYVPQKAIKGQVLADLLADHPTLEIPIDLCETKAWRVWIDGSRASSGIGAGVVLESPYGIKSKLSFLLDFSCTNNQAEYEALLIALDILTKLGVHDVDIFGNFMLVVK